MMSSMSHANSKRGLSIARSHLTAKGEFPACIFFPLPRIDYDVKYRGKLAVQPQSIIKIAFSSRIINHINNNYRRTTHEKKNCSDIDSIGLHSFAYWI